MRVYFFIGFLFLLLTSCTNFKNSNADAAVANIELGLGYLKLGNVVRAKQALNKAVVLAPKMAQAFAANAYLFDKIAENKEADTLYLKAISLSKTPTIHYNNYALFLCKIEKHDEADKYFKLALQNLQCPNLANIYNNAAHCAVKANNSILAKQYAAAAARHSLVGSQP